MLYETLATSVVESANADKETLAFKLIADAIADANDQNEARKALIYGIKGHIYNTELEERLISFISRTQKDMELDMIPVNQANMVGDLLAMNGQLKITNSQLSKYKSRANTASIIAFSSLVITVFSIGFALRANSTIEPTQRALEELSEEHSSLTAEYEALNEKVNALQSQNEKLLTENQEIEKALEPTKKENDLLSERNRELEANNKELNNRLNRICKRKRNLFFNDDCN
jgi:uncharacterized protein YoxC